MKWMKNSKVTSINDVVTQNTGLEEKDFLTPVPIPFIKGIKEAAEKIKTAVSVGQPIRVFADYDVDGITSASILKILFESLGCKDYTITFPDRQTGYGFDMGFVTDSLKMGDLLITIDNGITSINEIMVAKSKGVDVLVIDHHLKSPEGLPNADIIVDPHVDDESEYEDYCAAGLTYRLAQEMRLDLTSNAMDVILSFAALGTVADMVDLVRDGKRINHEIVREGLKKINSGRITRGLAALIRECSIYQVDEQSIGFSIAPCINAAGRMLKDGAVLAFKALSNDGDYVRACQDLVQLNKDRKALTSRAMATAGEIIAQNAMYGNVPMVIFFSAEDRIPVGICGLVASNMTELHKVPCFVLTDVNGLYKGSARSYGGAHLKETLDKAAIIMFWKEKGEPEPISYDSGKSIIGTPHKAVTWAVEQGLVKIYPDGSIAFADAPFKYGGHAAAAGLTCTKDQQFMLQDSLEEAMSDFVPNVKDVNYYDIEIETDKIADEVKKMETFAPYGMGNPAPIYKISDFKLFPRSGSYEFVDAKHCAKYVSNKSKIQLFGKNSSTASLFNSELVDKYVNAGAPTNLIVYGKISINKFKASATVAVKETPQIICDDFEQSIENTAQSDLLSALHSALSFV